MSRHARLLVLAPLAATAFAAAPAALAAPSLASSALPAASCSTSGILENGKVHLSGGGFTPGPAYISGTAGFGGTVEIPENGGFQSVGIAASARYEFRPSWFLNAEGSWNRFIGDAGKSPIVEAGDKNQFEIGLALSKRFQLDLF